MRICCVTQGAPPSAVWQPRGWDGMADGREVPEGGDIYIPMADSWCYLAKTSTIL